MVKNNITKNRIKFGFSLAEALVSMLVLSLFFMATAKIITLKQKDAKTNNISGYFECYVDNGDLKQHFVDGGTVTEIQDVSESGECLFRAPSRLPSITIYTRNTNAVTNATQFAFSTEPFAADTITITRADLATYHEQLNPSTTIGPEDITEDYDPFRVMLEISYPNSGLGTILEDDSTYAGPAVFISW